MADREHHPDEAHDEFDRGLAHDLQTMMNRRRMLFTVGGMGIGALLLAACGSDDGPSSAGSTGTSGTTGSTGTSGTTAATTGATDTTTAATTAATATTECVGEIPDETGGPYPGDGTNGVNVLSEDGIVRSDIRSSFGSSTTTTEGIPLDLILTIQDSTSCTPRQGAAVYLWHCTAAGEYSMYSNTVTDENFLRGVQESDSNGQVRFTTVVPGCYDGRWPHMHFEIFDQLTDAVSGNNSIKTTQLAIPEAVATVVYTDSRYPRSADNLTRVSLTSDMVFADDGGAQQLASMSGDNEAGYRAQLTVGI